MNTDEWRRFLEEQDAQLEAREEAYLATIEHLDPRQEAFDFSEDGDD